MAGAVYVLRYQDDINQFTNAFLQSSDFEIEVLKQVMRRFGVITNFKTKADIVSQLTQYLRLKSYRQDLLSIIIEQLVVRPKESIALKMGIVPSLPELNDPSDLVISPGKEEWYGPVSCPGDNNATWYIRPQLIDYWDILPTEQSPTLLKARWLCFARLAEDALSLHWKGFTYPNGPEGVQNNARRVQFPYWVYVPQFFGELEKLTSAKTTYVNLHGLFLHQLWDTFVDDKNYHWTHTRIRAESSGVSLNAHAGNADNELNVGGILHLARTVRTAVEKELAAASISLPSPEHIDNTILRTLIREYGALSYGFSLEAWKSVIFKAHSYFGLKPESRSADSFPHMQVTYSEKDALEQLQFVIAHARNTKSGGNDKPATISMF